jgi:hypothetical protein
LTGIPVVQLSNMENISVIFTAYDSPIWRAKLWVNPYEQNFPFMAEKDLNYNKFSVSLESIVIDFIEYLKVPNYNILRNTEKSWMFDPDDNSRIFIHFEQHNPPFKFLSFKNGLLLGFSYGKPVQIGELKTYPLLLDFPNVEDSTDHITYQKMKFASGNIVIDNSTGILDDLIELFGNDINLLSYNKDETLEIIKQFFVNNYTIGLNTVNLNVKDKRSRLTFKAPNTFYTKDKYPFIDDNLLEKVIQDAYGYCRGVAGTCLNRNEIYTQTIPALVFNDWFTFKFAREITSIEKLWINKSDIWTQAFPGLGVPDNNDYQTVNPHPIKIITKDAFGNDLPVDITTANMNDLPANDGRIQIWWSQALKDNPGHLYRRNGNAEKVKMTGVFVNMNTPGDIIKDMMVYYGELPYDASYFDLADWEKEMKDMKRIGICLNKSDDIYNWIEKIQNGSRLGFQLLIYKNLFSARVDNPNRQESFNIRWNEIKNRNDLEPELNGDNYATYTVINYLQDYTEDEWQTVIDKSQRLNILDVYKYEKEYKNNSYLIDEQDVIQKGRIILENFMQVRPIIRNIELEGLRWEAIKLFSTGYIDFSMELPRQMKIIQKYMKRRNSIGKIRVKVIGCKRDIKQEKISIDVIQCDKLETLNEMEAIEEELIEEELNEN